jgi:hypothetical protein
VQSTKNRTNDVTTLHNGTWLSVHLYIIKDWLCIPLLVGLVQIRATTSIDALTKVIMATIEGAVGLINP